MIIIIYNQFEQSSIGLRKNELQNLVNIGVNSTEEFRTEYRNGETNREEALEKISNLIRQFTYGDELQPNYLFMSEYDGTMLVQPYQPYLEGSNQLSLMDADGKFIIKELIAQAKSAPGWTFYKYYPPGSSVAHDKISYVIGLPELECYIGTGMYSTDIQQIVRKHFRQTLIFLLLIITALISSSIIIIYPIIFSVQIIARELAEIGDNPLLEAPIFNTKSFGPNSDARKLLRNFSEITEQLAAQNRRLIASAEEKDRLKTEHVKNTELMMKEMNHRVKNNLQIIIALLRIQLEQTDNNTIRESHLETISKLESFSIIHNMLYTNENYTSIPSLNYISDLVSYIIHSFGAEDRIKTVFNIDNTDLTIDQAVTLGIITNEVITNSVKYAFKPGTEGLITISLNSKEGKLSYYIHDNGSGIPEDILGSENSSLGISLIRNLSKQLKGNLEINTENGTSYSISFS